VSALNPFDRFFLDLFSGLPDWMSPFFSLLTQLGSPVTLVALSGAALVAGKGKIRAMAIVLLIGLFLGYLVMSDVKYIAERPRPDDARLADFASFGYSFPSGHALLAFLTASVIGGFLGWRYRLAGYLVAALIAASRLYLAVHYATDVIAGALIGVLIGEAAVFFAWRLGLCGGRGIAGLLPLSSPARGPDATTAPVEPVGRIAGILYCLPVAVALVLSINYFNTGHTQESLVLTIIVTVFVVLTAQVIKIMKLSQRQSMFFIVAACGFDAAFFAFYLDSFKLSLGIIVVLFLLLAWMTSQRNLVPGTREPGEDSRYG
jgi:undecaprenyl-diphosphatase